MLTAAEYMGWFLHCIVPECYVPLDDHFWEQFGGDSIVLLDVSEDIALVEVTAVPLDVSEDGTSAHQLWLWVTESVIVPSEGGGFDRGRY